MIIKYLNEPNAVNIDVMNLVQLFIEKEIFMYVVT